MTLPQQFLDLHPVGSSVELTRGYIAPVDFYGDVYAAVLERLPTLLPGLDYKAEHLCGPNFWLSLPPILARLAGRCIHDMVERQLLPLVVAPGWCGTLRYRLR